MYEDDDEDDQTKEPSTRGSDKTDRAATTSEPTMQTMSAQAPGGQPRWGQQPNPMMQRFGAMGGGQQGGGFVPPWMQGQAGGAQTPGGAAMQGRPDWGALIQRFRDRFQQHNPFLAGRFGAPPGAPPGVPPGAAPVPPQGAPVQQGAPVAPPLGAPQGGPAPWLQGALQNAGAAFARPQQPGGFQPGGILGPNGPRRY